MSIPLYQVDAFTDELFKGNPAAVCPLEEWLDSSILQAIAAENNLSETAFFVQGKEKDHFELRWFTPTQEIPLCGHATLASAFVIKHFIQPSIKEMFFSTKQSGQLIVQVIEIDHKEYFKLDFPSNIPEVVIGDTRDLSNALGAYPKEVWKTSNFYLAYFEEERIIKNLTPHMEKLKSAGYGHCIVTAPSEKYDFVSRMFAPSLGINEDPVTGAAHCVLAPFWAERLNKQEFIAKQVSFRGGEVICELHNDRVYLSGQATLYLQGTISLS